MSGRDHPRLVDVNMLVLVVDAEKVRALSTFHGNFYDSRFSIGHDRMHSQAQIRKRRNQIAEELGAFFREAPADARRAEVDRGLRQNQRIRAFGVTRAKSLTQFQGECMSVLVAIGQRPWYVSQRRDLCTCAHANSHSLEHRVRNRNCRSRVLACDKGAIDDDMRCPRGWRTIENRAAVFKGCLQRPRHPTPTDASLVLLFVSKRRHPIAVEGPQTVRSIIGPYPPGTKIASYPSISPSLRSPNLIGF